MAKGWSFQSGDWRAVCDSCGEKHYASELRKRWDGFRVCKGCFEVRHPQDFIRSRPDHQAVPWSRPQVTDTFLPTTINIQDTVYLYEDIDWINNKPPVVNTDSVTITELVTTQSNYYRIIPLGGDTTDGIVNGRPVDYFALNAFSTTFDNQTESFTLSENVSTYFTYTSDQSDNITLSESVTTFKFISNPLNAVPINNISLG